MRMLSHDKPPPQIKPWQQRAHLTSAYLNMLGDQFGLQGVEAAKVRWMSIEYALYDALSDC